jgi:Ca-activated chloride channel family protein
VRIRAEEVLAAMPAAGARPGGTQPVGISIHAVRSWPAAGERSSLLVEVAAVAGRLEWPATAPLEVTLVLDQSAAGDPGAWPRMCRGVAALAANLAPADRVTVVLCGPRARVAARAADAGQLTALAADLEWQPAATSADLDAGLALAGRSGRVVVVAHAVSLEQVRGEAREALAAWHTSLAEVGGDTLTASPAGDRRFVILDAATLSPASRSEPTFGRTSSDAVSIRRAILQQATGHDTLVAADCGLEVRFDPRRVARYRLIGHRQSAVQSLATTFPGSVDLHAGETVRAVYEVVPRNLADPQGLVTATVSWQAAGDGRQRLEARGLATVADLAAGLPSPHGCELLLAVAVGELAAGSAHLERPAAQVAAVESLLEAWRGRGDLTPYAAALAAGFERARSGRRLAW